jgi:hypothetical protein
VPKTCWLRRLGPESRLRPRRSRTRFSIVRARRADQEIATSLKALSAHQIIDQELMMRSLATIFVQPLRSFSVFTRSADNSVTLSRFVNKRGFSPHQFIALS